MKNKMKNNTKTIQTRHSAFGFTLVELLVVIAIIGVLVGLTVPAVQGVRSSARETTCLNNLRQLSTAALSHQTSNGYLPYYWRSYAKDSACWVVPLLPHLGETAIWQTWQDGTNNTAAYTTLNFLICPDTPEKRKNTAGLSYVANCGYCDGSKPFSDDDKTSVKAFQLGAFVPFGSSARGNTPSQTVKMKDGATYTILFSENNQATNWNSGTQPYNYGIFWFNNYGTTSRNFGVDFKSTSSNYDHARPSSYHPNNGANVAFADGGVKYCTKNIDALLYSQMMAPDDNKAQTYSNYSYADKKLTNPMNTQLLDR